MRVWCFGAGAVGGTVASRLARAGRDDHHISVVDANAEHVAIIRERGLVVGALGDDARTVLDARTPDELSATELTPDVVLLAVRSHATRTAARFLAHRIGPATDVVSLQNGLNEDTIAEIVGAGRTIGCVVGFGATWITQGRVELNATGELVIGRLDATSDERLMRVRELLDGAFPTRISSNIRGELWAKMLVNSMTVLGALAGMLTGEVLATSERRALVADVVAEGVHVAMSEGVALPLVFGRVAAEHVGEEARWHDEMQALLARMRERLGAIKSVTWRDFELGRATEIDAVTGEIVRRGARSGVPTPLSSAVYAMLREIEAGTRSPGAANLDGLAVRPGRPSRAGRSAT